MPKVKGKDLGRKIKILMVNEASFLRTGFSTYGWQVLKRLQETGRYEIVELASYATASDPRWKDPKWGINWKYYAAMPEPNDTAGVQNYQRNYHYGQFGATKFDEVMLKEKPDIVFTIRDYWMDLEWELRSPFRKYTTYFAMPCVDSHPPMPQWTEDYKRADYITAYSWYGKHVLEREGIKVHAVTNPGVELSVYNPGGPDGRAKALQRWGFKPGVKPILCVHRNQKRKLLPDMVYSYAILKNDYPEAFENSVLWIHTSWPDVGFNIPIVMERAKMGRIPVKESNGTIKERKLKNPLKYHDVVFSYICHACGHAFVSNFVHGMAEIREGDKIRHEQLSCELIPCQKCGKKEARMPNTQIGFNPEDFADVYRAAYVFVQPSIAGASEMPINEAKACGVPVIAPTHAAMQEVVEKTNFCKDDRHKGGLPLNLDSLFTEAETMQHRCIFSKEHLAKQLSKILTNKELHDKLSKEATECAKKYFNWDDIANKLDDLFQNTVNIKTGIDGWEAEPNIIDYGKDLKVPSPQEMNNDVFVRWCYKKFLGIDKPDHNGLVNWNNDLGRGRAREEVISFFKGEADKKNQLELIRTGKAPLVPAETKLSDLLDQTDTFRIMVVQPGTAGDIHLLTGALKSLYDKWSKQTKNLGLYVCCNPQFNDLLKNLPFVKKTIPYNQQMDNAKLLEQSRVVNIAYTPFIITQRFEHYAHNGYGKHLAQAYADMCGVELSAPSVYCETIEGLPSKYYVIHPTTSMKSKNWPIERWHSLVNLFPEETFILVGSAKDPEVRAPNVLDARGKTNWNQMAYLIKKAEGIIGGDSVGLHFASTLGTKSVGIFAATYPNVCGPMNSHGGIIVQPEVRPQGCQNPCHMAVCTDKNQPCITTIPVRQVAVAMETVF